MGALPAAAPLLLLAPVAQPPPPAAVSCTLPVLPVPAQPVCINMPDALLEEVCVSELLVFTFCEPFLAIALEVVCVRGWLALRCIRTYIDNK